MRRLIPLWAALLCGLGLDHAQAAVPADLSPTVWLEPRLGCKNPSNGNCAAADKINTLVDQSGNGNDCTQTTDANRPTYQTGIVNGQPSARFNGAAWLTCPNIFPTHGDYTIVVVVKLSTTTDGNNIVSGGAGSAPAHALWLNSTAAPRIYHNGDRITSSINLNTSAFHIIEAAVSDHSNGAGSEGTNFHVAIDGAFAGTHSYPDNSAPTADNSLEIGAFNSGAALHGDIVAVFLFNRVLAGADSNALNTYLASTYGLSPSTATLTVAAHGDSISAGLDGNPGYFETACNGNLGVATRCVNWSISANKLSEMNVQAVSYVDPFLKAGTRNILVVFAGTNDVGAGDSAATVYGNFQTYCAARKAAGWKVVAVTMLPGASRSNTVRGTLNTSLRADTCKDALADVAGDATIGCDSCNTNATYYDADQLHPILAGHNIIAPYIEAAVLSVPSYIGAIGALRH